MLPILGALVLQAAYGAVDLLVVGRFGTTSGLSAVSARKPVLNLVTFVITQFAMGITVLIARYIGEKNRSILELWSVEQQLFCNCFCGTFCSYDWVCTADCSADAGTTRRLWNWHRLMCVSAVAEFFHCGVQSARSYFQRLRWQQISIIIRCSCMCGKYHQETWFLVAGLHLDATGAAIATVTARRAVSVFCIIFTGKRELPFKITRRDFKINTHCIRALKVGLPLAMQEFLTQISFLALCAFVNRLGLLLPPDMVLPARSLTSQCWFQVLWCSPWHPLYLERGCRKRKKSEKSNFYRHGRWNCDRLHCICILLCLKEIFWPESSQQTQPLCRMVMIIWKGLRWKRSWQPFYSSMVGYFNGHDKTVWVMVQGLVQTLLVRLPLAYYMNYPARCEPHQDRFCGSGSNDIRNCAECDLLSVDEPETE